MLSTGCVGRAFLASTERPRTAAELGKRSSSARFFDRVLVFFRLQRSLVFGWSAVDPRVARTDAAVWAIALAAWQAGRLDLMRSPRLVLAHVWVAVEAGPVH
jgi:hypothetical protein